MSAESLFSSTPAHWRVTTLGELAESSGGSIQTGPFGSQLHAKDYVDDGIPSIMPKNISIDSVLTDDIARISPEDVERLAKYKVRTGDIVYSRRGDVEKCARITQREDGWLCGTGCLRVRVPPVDVSPEFLHAYLCHPQVREWIVRHAVGATMPNLNTSILSALPVVVPSRAEMEAISALWLLISEKLQLNHQINQTLEQMAQTIFKSWFVDFEPVKAKIAARERWHALQPANESASPVCYAGELEDQPFDVDLDTYMNLAAMQATSGKDADQLALMQAEHPEQYAELRVTAELFPSAMQDSEFGEIPVGWEAVPFGTLLSKTIGGDWGKDETDEKHTTQVRIIRGTDLPKVYSGDDTGVPVRYVEPKKLKSRKLQAGDIVLEVSGGSKGQPTGRSLFMTDRIVGRLGVSEPASFCRLLRPENQFIGLLLGLHLQAIYADGKTWLYQNQSTGISNFQTKVFLEKELVVVPTGAIQRAFYDLVMPLIQRLHSDENATLAKLRDTLLPKLLSGELTLPDNKEPLHELQDVAHV